MRNTIAVVVYMCDTTETTTNNALDTCFQAAKKFSDGAKSYVGDVLKLLHQILLEGDYVRKVLHQPDFCFLIT